jgi:hypothetical protein
MGGSDSSLPPIKMQSVRPSHQGATHQTGDRAGDAVWPAPGAESIRASSSGAPFFTLSHVPKFAYFARVGIFWRSPACAGPVSIPHLVEPCRASQPEPSCPRNKRSRRICGCPCSRPSPSQPNRAGSIRPKSRQCRAAFQPAALGCDPHRPPAPGLR